MIIKKISYLLTTIILFLGFVTTANASELLITGKNNILDFEKKGSIEVTLKDKHDDSSIEGAEITIYQVADAVEKDNNLVFEFTEELKDCDVILNDLKNNDLPKEITKCVNSKVINKKAFTDNNGIVKFSDLKLGLYLVIQSNTIEGYSNIGSFLVMIPEVKDNCWNYDIKSTPKTDVYKVIDLRVNKIWNSNSGKIPEKVIVELYHDGEPIDTVTLNKTNNWTYTWKNIEKSDKYEVKEIEIPRGYTPSYKNEGYVFTITNTDKLAETGQIYYPIIILFSLGLMLISSGVVLIRKGD